MDEQINDYINSTLTQGEEVLYWPEVSDSLQEIRRRFLIAFALGVLLIGVFVGAVGLFKSTFAIVFYGAACFIASYHLLNFIGISLIAKDALSQAITNKRVISVLTAAIRKTSEVRLSEIETITMTQGPFGRMYNYGDVKATGRGESKATLLFVINPTEVKKILELEVEKAKKQAAAG